MQNLYFEYPAWFLILCALAGLGVALILYFRDKQFAEQPRALVWGMGALRFLGYSLLAALLLSPLLRFIDRDQQEPVVVLAQDVSESVGLEIDTTAYREQWRQLRQSLGEQYQVVTYTFGQSLREQADELGFTDKRTNLDAILTEISDVYGTQNLGAVVLATDGIYNQGTNPAYRDLQLRAPVYTIGLGDTTVRRDLLVRRVFHNKIAYLEDQFSIQIDVAARNASGASTRLTVSKIGTDGGVLHSEDIAVQGGDFFTTKEVILTADAPGVQRYRIAVTGIPDEISRANNARDIFVDVLDARQKILLLAGAPHPDLGAFRQALSAGQNNEVETAYVDKFSGQLSDFDLVVLHQLPSPKNAAATVLTQLERAKVPTLFVLGERVPAAFNRAQDLLQFRGGSNNAKGNDVSPRLVGGFNLFTLSDELKQGLKNYPPLTSPFGEFEAGPGATTLLQQRIGRVDTEYPLLVVGESRGVRTGVIAGSGLWQWRLFDYLDSGSHENFDELVSQLTQYLTVQEDKRRFRVTLPKNIFDENEPVQLDAELYNSNYELINDPEATVTITGEAGREFEFAFTRTANAYTLNAGVLPVGNYRYRARTNAGEELSFNGRFSVQAVEVERFALEADHGLLRRLSERYGGAFLTPPGMADLPARIEAAGTVKPVLLDTVNTRSVINLKWLFFVLLALYAAEWFLRRFYGSY